MMQRNSKMFTLHQCTLLISCLALTGSLVAANNNNNNNNKINNNKFISGKQKPDLSDDLNASASMATLAQAKPQGRQAIYHSTIDRRELVSSNNNNNNHNIARSPIDLGSVAFASSPAVAPVVSDLATAAGHHHGHAHGKYYEYREVPKKKTWKFGYKRGNHKHTISRHEHGKASKKHSHFKTKVKWHDKKSKGKGIHLWDYNHHDKKHGHYG